MSSLGNHQSDKEVELMSQLREILLKEDRTALMELQQILNERSLLESRVNPIIEDHIEFLKKNFPKEYAQIIDKQITQKIKDSQPEILEVIYPVMGKMITKFISLQFQELKESIDAQINSLIPKRGFVGWIKHKFFGGSDAETVLASLDKPVLEEIFIIQRDSGLMLGNASLSPTVNREAVAGMLTAIKSFVEDAFEQNKEDLEMIQYGTYRILLHNFPTYYFALALSGSISTAEREAFRLQTTEFTDKLKGFNFNQVTNEVQNEISQQLENQFIIPQRQLN